MTCCNTRREGRQYQGMLDKVTEEGRAASKSPHEKFGCFLSMSQQAVFAEIIPNSAVRIFSPKTEGTNT
jgi:hypothetical protein